MDSNTSARFEEDLKNDPILQSEMNLYVEVDEALADTEVLNLRSQLMNMQDEFLPEVGKASVRKPAKRIFQIAAASAILALLTIGSFNLFRFGAGNQRIMGKFYTPYEMTMVNRSANSDINVIMHQALTLYDSKEYKEAVKLFEKVLEKDPSQMSTRLYSGISYMEIKEYQKAKNSFVSIIEQNDNLYIEQAQWYLGFCYVMMNEKQKAIKHFDKIAKSEGYYSEQAKQILSKLK